MAIFVLIVGSEVGGVLGAILSLPLTATVRDIAHYLYLRLSDQPLTPEEAVARVRGRSSSPSLAAQRPRSEAEGAATSAEVLPEKRS